MPSRPLMHRAAGWRPREVGLSELRAATDRARRDDPARALYRTRRWSDLRRMQLALHPLCQCDVCREGQGRVTAATVVDHVTPHRGDETLFFDALNLRSMAKRCHDRKTAQKDGGFGRSGSGA